jgi:hypothetical protein
MKKRRDSTGFLKAKNYFLADESVFSFSFVRGQALYNSFLGMIKMHVHSHHLCYAQSWRFRAFCTGYGNWYELTVVKGHYRVVNKNLIWQFLSRSVQFLFPHYRSGKPSRRSPPCVVWGELEGVNITLQPLLYIWIFFPWKWYKFLRISCISQRHFGTPDREHFI